MELALELNKNLELNKEDIPKEQKNFLETILGKTVNSAIDMGIRWALPNVIEDFVIDAKNTLLENGLKEGLTKVVSKSIDKGRNLLDLAEKSMKNMDQIKQVTEKGELVVDTSKLLESILKEADANKLLSAEIIKQLTNGKDNIVKNVEKEVDKTVKTQKDELKEVNKYIKEWDKFFKAENLEKLNETYEKLTNKAKDILPLEEIINKIKEITNLNELVNNKGSFDITEHEKELAKILG